MSEAQIIGNVTFRARLLAAHIGAPWPEERWIYMPRPCYMEVGDLITIIEQHEGPSNLTIITYPAKCTNVRVYSTADTTEIVARYTGRAKCRFGWHVLPTSHLRYKPLKIR